MLFEVLWSKISDTVCTILKVFLWQSSPEIMLRKACNRYELKAGEEKPLQISRSVAQLCPTLCNSMDCSMPGFLVHHQLPELAQTYVHWVDDVIQPSPLLSSHSPLTFNLSQHQGLFQWVSSSHQVTKILEFQLQRQSFQWIFRIDFL